MNSIIFMLVLFGVLTTIRVLIGPSFWDRLMGLNLVTSKLIMVIVVIALMRRQSYLLDIAMVYGLIGFVGTAFMAIYIQRRGRL